MSAVMPSWKTGACHASVSRRAIVLRIDESSCTSTPSVGTAAGASGRAGAADAAARSTSSATTRPSGTGAGDAAEVDTALARDPACERRGLDPTAVVGRVGAELVHLACRGRLDRGAAPLLTLSLARRRGRALLLL